MEHGSNVFLVLLILLAQCLPSVFCITVDVCKGCCDNAFDDSGSNFYESACDAGCLGVVSIADVDANSLNAISDSFSRAACSSFKEQCKVGVDWILTSQTSRSSVVSLGNILDGSVKFCAPPDVISNTAGPTASPTTPAPTPPTPEPTSLPTSEPSVFIPSNSSQNVALPAAIAGLAALIAFVGGCYVYSKRKYTDDQKAYERKSEKAWIVEDPLNTIRSPIQSKGEAPPGMLEPPPGLPPPGLPPPGMIGPAVPPEPIAVIEFTFNDEENTQKEEEENLRKPFRAIARFEAEQDDEIALEVGDTVLGVRPVDSEWWEVEFNGRRGIVPLNFLEEI